jgi:hypothetical protein
MFSPLSVRVHDTMSAGRKLSTPDHQTVEEWASVLVLAIKFDFPCIRELASESLYPMATAADKITYGSLHEELVWWLKGAYLELCKREQPLTPEEGRQVGIDSVVQISRIRQEIRQGSISRPDHIIVSKIQEAFPLST